MGEGVRGIDSGHKYSLRATGGRISQGCHFTLLTLLGISFSGVWSHSVTEGCGLGYAGMPCERYMLSLDSQ